EDSNSGSVSVTRVFCAVAVSNPNVHAFGGRQSGWTVASGNSLVSSGQAGENFTPFRRSVSHASYTIPAGGVASPSITVSGIKAGDPVYVSMPGVGSSNVLLSAQATSDNTVRVVISNPTANPVTIPAGTATFMALRA